MKVKNLLNLLEQKEIRRSRVVDNRDIFLKFLEVYSELGGEVNEVTTEFIERSLIKNRVTNYDLGIALIESFENDKYGSLNWGKVMDVIREKRNNPTPQYLTTQL